MSLASGGSGATREKLGLCGFLSRPRTVVVAGGPHRARWWALRLQLREAALSCNAYDGSRFMARGPFPDLFLPGLCWVLWRRNQGTRGYQPDALG